MHRIHRLLVLTSVFLFVGAGCLGTGNDGAGTTGPAGMYLSTDRGDTWRQIDKLPLPDGVKSIGPVSVYRIIEDPADEKAMYLGTRSHGLIFSYDEGASWHRAAAPLDSGFVYDIAIHPEDNCTIYAPLGSKLYKTTDCSRNWTEVYRESRSGINIVGVTFDHFAPQRVIIAQSNGDVLQTFDGGESWGLMRRFGTRIVDLISDTLQPNTFYITTRSQGMRISTDGGNTWNSNKEQIEKFSGGLEFRRLYLHPDNPGEMYWLSTYGVMKSVDSGASWGGFSLITPPGSVNIYAFGINPNNDNDIYYTATPRGSVRTTFYRSDDGGATWTTKQLPTGQIPTAMRIHPEYGEWIFLGFTIPPSS